MRRVRGPGILAVGVLVLVVGMVTTGVLRATTALERTLISPTPAAIELFGWTAIQAGTTSNVLIGAPFDRESGTSAGAVYVVNGINGAPVFPSPIVPTPTPAASDQFGAAVAYLPVSGSNPAMIIVGTPGDDPAVGTDAGAVYVFNASTAAWIRTVAGLHAGDAFGTAVAILGQNLVVGAPWADVGGQQVGAVYVVDSVNGTILKTCANPFPAAGDRFGETVAVLGTTIVVGAPYDDGEPPDQVTDSGTVYFFDSTAPGSACPQIGTALRKPAPIEPGDLFGHALAAVKRNTSLNGPVDLLVGAPYGDTQQSARGAAFLFDGTTHTEITTVRSPQPGSAADGFGWAVAAVGSNLLVGAPEDDTVASNAGAVYLFDPPSPTPLEIQANFTDHGPLFGWTVAAFSPPLLGAKFLVGAPFYVDTAQWQGAAHVFHTSCGNKVLDTGTGEACDDGAMLDGDCCSSACQFEPDGQECADDTDCTIGGTTCLNGVCGTCNLGGTCTDICGGDAVCNYDAGARCICQGTSTTSTTSTSSSTTSTSTSTSTSSTAPPLNETIVTDIGTASEFLYTGPNPIQTGVAPGTIVRERAAVLQGKVRDRDGQSLEGVSIAILGHPEFGQTHTQVDGTFNLAVNGGGVFTVTYSKADFLTVHRQVDVAWQSYAFLPDVALVQADVATPVFNNDNSMQVAQGSPVPDDGGRQATLLFPAHTQATLVINGSEQPYPEAVLSVRATEYTVGPNGPAAMPAELPPTSAYTYAVELSVDQMAQYGATEVRFNQPVFFYLRNFLDFPVGGDVPTGYYDRTRAMWVPSENGRIIEVLSVTPEGLANVDTDGDGQVDNGLLLSDDERQRIATLFPLTQGRQTLWRVPIQHFSAWDCNWGFSPPDGADDPNQPPPHKDDSPDGSCPTRPGSVLYCESQTLGESLPVTGTPFTLEYRSNRVLGRTAANSLTIFLSGDPLPSPLKAIELDIRIVGAGRRFIRRFEPPTVNQTFTLDWNTLDIDGRPWDGRDAFGRRVQGQQRVVVRIGYVYDGVYKRVPQFGYNGNGLEITGSRTRQEVAIWQTHSAEVGLWSGKGQDIGGWSLSAHHAYDTMGRALYLGTGDRQRAEDINSVITTLAGNGQQGGTGDGGAATSATLNFPGGVVVAPDGTTYIADTSNHRIRKVTTDGTIMPVAGGIACTPATAVCGDGGDPLLARLNQPAQIALGPDGSLYIADRLTNRVRRIANGVITTIAGNGTTCTGTATCGDGGLATAAGIGSPEGVAVASDGSVYISDTVRDRVRRVAPDGVITTVAGTGVHGFFGEGIKATDAQLNAPHGLAIGPDGSLYIADTSNQRVRRVSLDGIITTVAGTGSGTDADGIPATTARLSAPNGIAFAVDGTLYIADTGHNRVRSVAVDGIIRAFACTGTGTFSGEGGASTAAECSQLKGLTVTPDRRVLLADTGNHRVRQVAPPFPGIVASNIVVPAADGSEIYVFDRFGRHLETRHPLTGAVQLTFGYDAEGRLNLIADPFGNETHIERDLVPPRILAPGGQITTLAFQGDYLAAVANEAGYTTELEYTPEGLLRFLTRPNEAGQAQPKRYEFNYDTLGRLERDDDPAGGRQTLARTQTTLGYIVDLSRKISTTAQRLTSYAVERPPSGGRRRIITDSANLVTETLIGMDGTNTVTTPDEVQTILTPGPDPRFGMQHPVQNLQTTIPTSTGSLVRSVTEARSVTLDIANPLRVTDATTDLSINGHTYRRSYVDNTMMTRTLTDTSPEGRQLITRLDAQGRPIEREVFCTQPGECLAKTTLGYNPHGQLETIARGTGPGARTYILGYDTKRRLDDVRDPLQRIVGFGYDLADRVTSVDLPTIPPATRTVGFGYDPNANMTRVTPPGLPAHDHFFDYTPVDLEQTYTPPDVGMGATTITSEYNLTRQLRKVFYPDAPTTPAIEYTYEEPAGRLQSVTTAAGTVAYTYDATKGTLEALTAPGCAVPGCAPTGNIVTTYTFDGNLLTDTTWSGSIAGSVGLAYDTSFRLQQTTVTAGTTVSPITLGYDDDGLLTQAGALTLTRHPDHGLVTDTTLAVGADAVVDARAYNAFGELRLYQATWNGQERFRVEIPDADGRDALGRILKKQEWVDGASTPTVYEYGYDPEGRLGTVTRNGVQIADYTYDANGNRLTAPNLTGAPVYDAQDRLLQYGTTAYTYTADGRLASKTVGTQETTYGYDARGNLRTVVLPSGTVLEYLIDGENRRVAKLRRIGSVWEVVRVFLYEDQLRIAAELDGNGTVVTRFVYGTGVNVPEYMIKYPGTPQEATYRIITDHLGSPRRVINVASGDPAQILDYDEFGGATIVGPEDFQPFGFAGGIYDADTRLVRFGARDYDAMIGRWTTKDPIKFDGGDLNLYAYAAGDPINLKDSTGLDLGCYTGCSFLAFACFGACALADAPVPLCELGCAVIQQACNRGCDRQQPDPATIPQPPRRPPSRRGC